LADVEGGAQALSEVDLERLCRRHRIPQPQRQVLRRSVVTRRNSFASPLSPILSSLVGSCASCGRCERLSLSWRHPQGTIQPDRLAVDEAVGGDVLDQASIFLWQAEALREWYAV